MTTTLAPHADEGALVRALDGALEPDESAAVREHIAHCPTCRDRLNTLRILSRGWSRILEQADADLEHVAPASPPHRQLDRRWLLRAAAIVLVAGAIATPPVRAGIAQLWERVTAAVAAPDALSDAPPLAGSAADVLTLSFPFAATSFVLAFDSAQPAGTVLITFGGAGPDATARVEGRGQAELLVRPEGLRVRNGAADTAVYRIDLPAGVRDVRVEVAGAAVRTVRAGTAVQVRVPVGN